ncbi:vascular endothelial growth factor receptor kdr-like [Macrobrachium nipponense]|uniref:vascular endothelial growth factor receptor kdr-like n=1 Tax=Macrobrachium nipponense TaxID=159736 RepID=UPI0030C7F33E
MREIKVYILLFWLGFTAVRSQQDVSPPRILNGEELLVNGGPVTLTCEGDEPFVWTYKYLDCHYDMGKQNQTSKTDGSYRSQLTLNNQNSQGHYHCHYENTSLSDPRASASTYVYLFSDEERFAEIESDWCQDSRITGNVGGQVVLDCRPTQPNLTVVVEHGDEEIHRGPLEDPRAGYELRNLTEDSSGEYRCSVHNFSKVFEVEVQGTLKSPKLGITKNTFPVVGYSMELFCQIPDNKFQLEPTFTWTRLNKDKRTVESLPEHHRVQSHMYYASYLLVQNVTLEDSGTYECTVNTEGRPPLQTATYISIRESEDPFLKVSPVTQNITLREGDELFWELEVESFPPFPIIQTSDEEFYVMQDENGITIHREFFVDSYDFGEHTVNISTRSHSLGVKTAQVHLYLKVESETILWIQEINAITTPNDTVMRRLNSTVTLQCNAIVYPMENITWHYQSCPNGEPCPQSFSDLKCSQITYAVQKENNHSSECTFVATETARILCRSGDEVESKNIVVSGGDENPSDCLTRCVSEKMLRSTLFLTGPKFLDSPSECRVIVPHPGAKPPSNETARSTIHLLVHAQKAAFPQVYDALATDQDDSWGVSDDIFDNNQEAVLSRFGKLMKVKANLEKIYQGEFTATLFSQAMDRKNRYDTSINVDSNSVSPEFVPETCTVSYKSERSAAREGHVIRSVAWTTCRTTERGQSASVRAPKSGTIFAVDLVRLLQIDHYFSLWIVQVPITSTHNGASVSYPLQRTLLHGDRRLQDASLQSWLQTDRSVWVLNITEDEKRDRSCDYSLLFL